MKVYEAELSVPQEPSSIAAVQGFVLALCESLRIPGRTRQDLELALEEGLTALMEQGGAADREEPLKVTVGVDSSAVRFRLLAPGRPFDFRKLPQFSPEDCETSQAGLGLFLMRHSVDSLSWRYLEKQGRELTLFKAFPSPLLGEEVRPPLPAEGVPVAGRMEYRLLRDEADALAVAVCAYDVYRYAYKDVIYYPEQLLEKNRGGLMRSWIAVDEGGTVHGHYALIRKRIDASVGEMGAAFVRPERRREGVFGQLAEEAHRDAFRSGLRGIFSLSVTNHTATQKVSERYGRRTVGIRLASSPGVFVEGARPGDRVTTVLNVHPLNPRPRRVVYPPERYRDLILRTYGWLDLPVELGNPADPTEREDGSLDRDLVWNRATLELRGGGAACARLEAYTELLREQEVACILLSLNLEDPGAIPLAETAARLGYVYSGVFPDGTSDGKDALQLQRIGGPPLDPEEIHLHQESAGEILAFLRRQSPEVFLPGGRP